MTTQTQPSVDSKEASYTIQPGQRLQQARSEAGLSIEEVAARLCLRHSVIVDLEADDYSSISGMVFARGYLRAYSKLLGVDPDEIIEAFNALGLDETQAERTLWQSPKAKAHKGNPVKWLFIFIGSFSIILAVL